MEIEAFTSGGVGRNSVIKEEGFMIMD